MWKLGLSTEEEFLSETSILFFSSSKLKFRDLDQEIWWVKLWESQTLVWPLARKTLSIKTTKFWYIRYILRLAKDQGIKIVGAENQILLYTMSKFQPYIIYILGDIIPPS